MHQIRFVASVRSFVRSSLRWSLTLSDVPAAGRPERIRVRSQAAPRTALNGAGWSRSYLECWWQWRSKPTRWVMRDGLLLMLMLQEERWPRWGDACAVSSRADTSSERFSSPFCSTASAWASNITTRCIPPHIQSYIQNVQDQGQGHHFVSLSCPRGRGQFYLTSSGRSPVRLSTVGRRAFPVSGATVWNDLHLHVASAPSVAAFRQRLKTFLFSRSYQDTIIWLVCYYHHSSLLSGHLRSLH